jgi:hypothetical protein
MASGADFNLISEISRTFKGYFTIRDGTTDHRYKLLQDITITTASDFEKVYSDTGIKALLSIGDSSTFSATVKKTADLWDIAAGTKTHTLGFFHDKIINKRLVPEAFFQGVSETEAQSNKFIVVSFNAFVTGITDTRNPTTGAPEVVISGEIKDMTVSQRQAAAPA